jgi:hypothetical protein
MYLYEKYSIFSFIQVYQTTQYILDNLTHIQYEYDSRSISYDY